MSEYSERLLVEKLGKLVDTQDSITQTSYWITHHRIHAQASVSTWLRELKKASPARKLSFLYLANDVVQTSRKKGEELVREFGKILPDAYIHIYRTCPHGAQNKVLRILQIWLDRTIYPADFLTEIRRTIKAPENGTLKAASPSRRSASSSSSSSSPPFSCSTTSNNNTNSSSILTTSLPAEIRPVVPLYANIEKQQAIVTDITVQISKIPQDWLQQDLATLHEEQTSRTEAIGTLEDARRKLQTLKAAISAELKDRQLLAAELSRLQQANDLAMKGVGTAETDNETHLAIIDIQLNNLKHALESSATALSSNPSDELPPIISPTIPMAAQHHETRGLSANESNNNSSIINSHIGGLAHAPPAEEWSGTGVIQDGLLSGDLSSTDLTTWGS
ncbi:hypothetical protein SeMB42_g07605 [Synchytrium endobioticum]|uniref:CID domain-containing protein n=1 Tax=Synchytrium endobioticum TaxID=286115 RepID=A0A507C3F7_9FUNG|nr:hypothetical protein SeMB42_g07605 [Synchytrium endobioticum]TPX44067.1 hypothetical protein SeLEV6574_g04727 [Synchytrium endobioticum]